MEVRRMKNKLTESKEELQTTIFDKKKLLFNENESQIESKIIGNLTNKLLADKFEFFKNAKPKNLYFTENNCNMLSFFAWETELNKYCMVGMADETYEDDNGYTNFTITLKLVTEDGKMLKEVKETVFSEVFGSVKFNNTFIITYCQANQNPYNNYNRYQRFSDENHWSLRPSLRTNANRYIVRSTAVQCYNRTYSCAVKKFDFNLNLIATEITEFLPTSINVNDNQIYIFSVSSSSFYVYNQDLNLIPTIPFDRTVLSFNESNFVLKYGKLFSYTNTEILIYDLKTQTCLEKVKIGQKYSNVGNNNFAYPLSEYTFLIISRSGDFVLLDLLGFLMEFSIRNIKYVLNFEISESENVLICDSNRILHVYSKN
jgi:hypothetical protein